MASGDTKADRTARLAAALRANLRRRKASPVRADGDDRAAPAERSAAADPPAEPPTDPQRPIA